MQPNLDKLKSILAEVSDLQNTAALLSWDQQTYMPPGGAEARGEQLGTVNRLAHEKFTSSEVGRLLEELEGQKDQMDPDSDEARLIKVTAREYEKKTRVPPEMVVEFSRLTTVGQQVWQEARAEDDFPKFQPYLEKIVDWRQRYAELFTPYDHVYDPLLDDFEPGMKTADVTTVFNELRPQQVALIAAIAERESAEDSFLHQPFDADSQWEFGVEVISKFGYDWQRGRQDKSVHPFTISFGLDDVRITTRISPDFFNPCLFGTMHEAGHALYELGVDHALRRTPLTGGASLAVHESQSRLWENLVGRSRPFWEHFYPRLKTTFPEQFADVDLETFYKGINKVEPSLIRVEADEATYNLHIMLRLELEISLMEGSLAVKDLPEAWNTRMEAYLGIVPPNNRLGVLQDVHWSGGMIGYFSTYALGNLIAAQLWNQMLMDIPDLNDQIRAGEFTNLLGWLREKVHRHGSKFEPAELVERITGEHLHPEPYINYLQDKFGEIYALEEPGSP
jgi:carboxypeptidase Taq